MYRRNRSSCLCGYEGRVDKVNEHKKRCRGFPIIKELIEQNKKLKTIIAAHGWNMNTLNSNEKISEIREDTKKIEDMKKQDTSGFAYIIREREFLRMNENVFKVGKCEDIVKRFKNYPNGSELVKYYKTSDRHAFEKLFLMELKNSNIKHRKDVGSEYFEGDISVILGILESVVKKELVQ